MVDDSVEDLVKFDIDSSFPKPHEWDMERIKRIEAKLDKNNAWDDPEPSCLTTWEQRYFHAYCSEIYYDYLSDNLGKDPFED